MSDPASRPPLDPDATRFLMKLNAAGLRPIDLIPLAQARVQASATVVSADAVGSVRDESIPRAHGAVGLRIYRPQTAETVIPAIVFFHGGGWVFGSLDSHDGLCRRLCRITECAVISVDYRLAPEHPFPAAVEDAEQAVAWVAAHAAELDVDPDRIVVCGDSAGANLATVAALRLRDRVTLAAQVLWYPVTSFETDTNSYQENQEGFFLSRSDMQWFMKQYLKNPRDGEHPDAAPLSAPDLRGSPPTYLLTAGYDPLRDHGRAYAQRLIAAAVTVHFTELDGLIHGFMRRLDDFSAANRVIDDVTGFLQGIFRGVNRAQGSLHSEPR